MAKGLTKYEESLVQAMLTAKSQREAYKKSLYKSDKMTDDQIDREVCVILKKPRVAQRLEELQGKMRKKIEEEGLMTATDVLKGIADIYHRNAGKDDRQAIKALELYGKYHKLFTDKVEHSGEIDIKGKSKIIGKYLKGD